LLELVGVLETLNQERLQVVAVLAV